MSKLKLIALLFVLAAVTATGAGWKWKDGKPSVGSRSAKIAGWTWDEALRVSD